MKHPIYMAFTAATLGACGPDETISGYANRDATYVLTTVDDVVFEGRATIAFAEKGRVIGSGPCNIFNASQSVPYPWFELGPIASTRMACADLALENDYFTALAQMRFAEVAGDILILSDEDERLMVFQAE